MKINEINCRTIISKSGIPGCDYAINPYIGCSHACVYCYAKYMMEFTGHVEPWGEFVDARVNAADAAVKQLRSGKYAGKNVILSSVTDPYQPAEKKYSLMRELLPLLDGFGVSVSVLTKSSLVARDIDLLKGMKDVEVGITITGIDERAREAFEPGASPYAERLFALERLAGAGIDTYVFVGPVLPGITDRDIEALLRNIKDAGAKKVLLDKLNYSQKNLKQLLDAAALACPDSAGIYGNGPEASAKGIKKIVRDFSKDTGLPCRMFF